MYDGMGNANIDLQMIRKAMPKKLSINPGQYHYSNLIGMIMNTKLIIKKCFLFLKLGTGDVLSAVN